MMSNVFVWTPWGLSGIIVGSAAFLLASFIWRTTINPVIRNRLTLLLVLEGVGVFFGIGGAPQFMIQEAHYRAVLSVHFINDCLLIAFYLPCIAIAVDSPMLRPFRDGIGRRVPGAIGFSLLLTFLLAPQDWVVRIIPGAPGFGAQYGIVGRPVMGIVFCCLVVSYVYGFVGTLQAWFKATTATAKRKTGVLATAFGVRDITAFMLYLSAAIATFFDIPTSDFELQRSFMYAGLGLYAGLFVYVLLVAYAIAFVNVLDIDLKVKWTLKQSTVTAIFLAFFFIVSEMSAALLSERLGTLLALIASGVLLFFIAPLQNWVERLTDRAMPAVRDTPEYQKFRSLQIYGAAVEEALREGGIGPAQRVALDHLRGELALGPLEAESLERDLLGAHS